MSTVQVIDLGAPTWRTEVRDGVLNFLSSCAAIGRAHAARYRIPVNQPYDLCPQAVAEWRARGYAGLRNRHFRRRSASTQSKIILALEMRR